MDPGRKKGNQAESEDPGHVHSHPDHIPPAGGVPAAACPGRSHGPQEDAPQAPEFRPTSG
ncbi:MAG: hypothetical protein AMJ94_12750 [Deltaproteobacteria bacterium SM23_61]|nr:MAG: hypothetical protein AMJ94_12750 [Deltaproteobacteria bacterium SM23_61]